MANPPKSKRVGFGTLVYNPGGNWTTLSVKDGHENMGEEEVRDLHYALTRIINYYDELNEEKRHARTCRPLYGL